MKRISMFFVLFLTTLCCTLMVSAADYAIHSVTIRGNAVQVSVTAQSDCALWCAVYEKSGKMTAANSANVSGAADTQTVTLSFDNIPADAYAKAVLLEKEMFRPSCSPSDTRNDNTPVYTSDVYAILYTDGTMVFQHGDTPQAGREVKGTYAVDMAGSYHDNRLPPWHDIADSIECVEFADKIQPKSTAYWFLMCYSLKQIRKMQNLDTSNVTDMSDMFNGCRVTELDVSSLNTANVTNMNGMFSFCTELTELDISNFNTANVTDMGNMFRSCAKLAILNISNLNTASVTNMDAMFLGCQALTTLDVSSFDTVKVTGMNWMFQGCTSLTALNISNFNTANVTGMGWMFAFCEKLTTLNVGNLNTSNVTSMFGMFSGCSSLVTLDVGVFDTTNVTHMDFMFSGCAGLTVLDVSSFNTTNVTNMSGMFRYCRTLKTLDLSGFNTANVTDMSEMFTDCSDLIAIYVSGQFIINDEAKYSYDTFKGCLSLVGSNGTTYNRKHTDIDYAHIDGGAANPGYFTAKP